MSMLGQMAREGFKEDVLKKIDKKIEEERDEVVKRRLTELRQEIAKMPAE